jgi:hypothetical protein
VIRRAQLRVNPLLLAALAIAVGWYIPRMHFLADTRAEALAYTDCPWRSPARVTLTDRVMSYDSLPVLAHERVHARQCEELGPLRYRVRNLTAKGRLSLEAPAYCAGARERARLGMPAARVRERLVDDAAAAFSGSLDEATVLEFLRLHCDELLIGAASGGASAPRLVIGA